MRAGDPTKSVDNVICVKETEKAICIKINDPKYMQTMWLPKSQLHADSQVYEMDTAGTIIMSQWIYDQKNWEEFSQESML